MSKNYWNKNGENQKDYAEIRKLVPGIGYTNNKFLDLFITASKLYYDVYNNGGYNIRSNYLDDIKEYIEPFSDNIKTIHFNLSENTIIRNIKNKEKLELFFDEVIDFVKDKDLKYTKYFVYQNYDENKLSNNQIEGFSEVSFGNKKDFDEWVGHRVSSWKFKFI